MYFNGLDSARVVISAGQITSVMLKSMRSENSVAYKLSISETIV